MHSPRGQPLRGLRQVRVTISLHSPSGGFLPGESHGQKSLVGYSPWGHKESDTTEHLSTHTGNRNGLGDRGNRLVLSEEEGAVEGRSGRLGSADVAFISRMDKQGPAA